MKGFLSRTLRKTRHKNGASLAILLGIPKPNSCTIKFLLQVRLLNFFLAD